MFLEYPFKLKVLEVINDFSHILYEIIFIFVQVIAPFIIMVLLVKLFEKLHNKKLNSGTQKIEK